MHVLDTLNKCERNKYEQIVDLTGQYVYTKKHLTSTYVSLEISFRILLPSNGNQLTVGEYSFAIRYPFIVNAYTWYIGKYKISTESVVVESELYSKEQQQFKIIHADKKHNRFLQISLSSCENQNRKRASLFIIKNGSCIFFLFYSLQFIVPCFNSSNIANSNGSLLTYVTSLFINVIIRLSEPYVSA